MYIRDQCLKNNPYLAMYLVDNFANYWKICSDMEKKNRKNQGSDDDDWWHKADHHIAVQTDSRLLVLASGCIGGKFRLYKKNREKYGRFLHPLAKMIVTNKSQSSIPVEQRSRDQGGLHCLSRNFLPPLRLRDHTLIIELSKSKEYGKKLSIIYSIHISLF